jgi:DNA-binding response OmpR family regulator
MQQPRPVVLAADDDEDILELIRLRLSRSGFELLLARDGPEALALARERKPDLALLDVAMPGLDGFGVAAALKADAETAQIKIVMLTARAQKNDVAQGFAAGADDYITKPFSPQALQARVTELLAPTTSASADEALEPLLRTVAGR